MLRICVLAVAPGFPSTILHEIHDNFMLALDAYERPRHSQPERDARSYGLLHKGRSTCRRVRPHRTLLQPA